MIMKQRILCRGAIMHEALIAVLLVTMVMAGAAEVLVGVSKQSRAIERRSLARREAGNLMEEAMLMPWQELAAQPDRPLELSETAQTHLTNPQARLNVSVPEGDADVMRIAIEVTWGDVQQRPVRPLRLVAWRYRHEETQP